MFQGARIAATRFVWFRVHFHVRRFPPAVQNVESIDVASMERLNSSWRCFDDSSSPTDWTSQLRVGKARALRQRCQGRKSYDFLSSPTQSVIFSAVHVGRTKKQELELFGFDHSTRFSSMAVKQRSSNCSQPQSKCHRRSLSLVQSSTGISDETESGENHSRPYKELEGKLVEPLPFDACQLFFLLGTKKSSCCP